MRKYSCKSLEGDLSIETAIRELKLGCNVTMSIGRLEMEMPRLMSTLTTAKISSRVLLINNLPEHKLVQWRFNSIYSVAPVHDQV